MAKLGTPEYISFIACVRARIFIQRNFRAMCTISRWIFDLKWVVLYDPYDTVHMKFCMKCSGYQFQCDNYLRPVFTLTNVSFVNRTFAILSLIFMGGAQICLLFGMECTKGKLPFLSHKIWCLLQHCIVMKIDWKRFYLWKLQ